MIKIWQRYLLKELFKVFFLFLFCFYGLYILIDYASHTSALAQHHGHIHNRELCRYYLFIFSSRAEILIPFALIVAIIKTFCSLNSSHELVAFMAGGIRLTTLYRPFLYVGLAFTCLLYLNEQYLLPSALKKLRYLEDATKHQSSRNKLTLAAHSLILEDGSLFLFQNYDTAKEQFFDVYWIASMDSIYRIKTLSPHQIVPVGFYVEHLQRQADGTFAIQQRYEQLTFPCIHFNQKVLQSTLTDPEALSLKAIWSHVPQTNTEMTAKESRTWTALWWKMLIPWLCLLAVIAPIPSCIKFSRTRPIFLIYTCGIFGMIAFYFFLDAAQVIAKKQILDPSWALGCPFFVAFSITMSRLFK